MRTLFTAITLATATLYAQVNLGTITGTVTDTTDASIVGASVTLTNQATGTRGASSTTNAGAYTFLALQPGAYSVQVEAPGFKTAQRRGIVLEVGGRIAVDIRLEVGDASDRVTVTSDAPLLSTENASVGQVIDSRKILELPLPSRDPLRLAQIAPGVGGQGGGLGDFRLGGGRVRQVEHYVDGSPVTAVGDARASAVPSIDAIQEFKVETNNLSAEYGRTSGGAINIQTRSGSNQFHGSLYEFARSDIFNANSWDANRRGSALGGFRQHTYGGTIGGPVKIPKLYNGTNKTFFFFNYDGYLQDQDGFQSFATVPTELERRGDFSQTANINGQRVTLYDPSTYNAATNSRQAFANNLIPENRIDPVARYMLALFPQPNRTADPNGQNNFAGFTSDYNYRRNFTARVDQNFGDKQRLYVRITRNAFTDKPSYWAGPATAGVRDTYVLEPSSTLNYTITAKPTLLFSAQLGVTPRVSQFAPVLSGYDPTQIPFASNVRGQLDPRYIPNIQFEKLSGLGGTFITTDLRERYFYGDLSGTKVFERHTVKFGYQQRRLYLNDKEPGAPSGSGVFDGAWTGLNQQAPLAQQGSGFGSFLLGLPNSFSFDSGLLGHAFAFRNHALYVQDDFKVNQRLTVNLGLRWEYEAPITERFDRLVIIDYQADNGYRTNANYNFARDVIGAGTLPAGSPVPNLSGPFRGGIGLPNTSQFPGRESMKAQMANFAPRLGLAYQIRPKTVFRAGFALMYAGYNGNASSSDAYGGSAYFKTRGSALISPDNGRTYQATLTNPFPNNSGLLFGTTDPNTTIQRYFGNLNRAYEYDHKLAYEVQYNGGLQQQLGQWLLEGTFVANKGTHLYVGGNPSFNTLDPKYLSLGALLDRPVPNPFYNAGNPDNGNQLTAATVPYKSLLLPYPHLLGGTSILQRASGNSHYMSGQFKIERRYSAGLSLLVAYTISKLIDDTNSKAGAVYSLPQDGANFRDIRGLDVQDIPQKLVITYLYDLPFAKGNRFAGGWKIAGFTNIQSGYPLQIQQSDNFTSGLGYGKQRPTLVNGVSYFGDGVDASIGLPGRGQTGRYINRDAFTVTPRYQFGNVPAVLPNFRQPRFNQTDLALLKEIRINERTSIELRIEAQNAFNHPIFQLTNNELNIQNANFGLFNSTANGPRNVQFGARFRF